MDHQGWTTGAVKINLNMIWTRVAYLIPFLLILAAACGPAEPAINAPVATLEPAATTSPTEASSTPPPAVKALVAASAPTASKSPSPAVAAKPTASVVLAETTLVHDGFRTEVSQTLIGAKIESRASAAGGKRTVTVSLRNLSQSTGGIQSRATINFAPEFNNFVVLPTPEGPLTLYLHRDGTLGPAPDTGGFT